MFDVLLNSWQLKLRLCARTGEVQTEGAALGCVWNSAANAAKKKKKKKFGAVARRLGHTGKLGKSFT